VPKSIFTARQKALQEQLKAAREKAGLTQHDLARVLARPQSFVSKVESGERVLDLIELQQFCVATGISLRKFIEEFERQTDEG
jgi:transcriptional regulator with XRE-family HTH domain